MKKLLLIAAFVGFSTMAVQAQEVRFGAKAGVNFANVNGDDVDDTNGRAGIHVGGVARIGISEMFSIQPELVFSSQGYKFNLPGEDGQIRLGYINIPVLADITLADGFSLQGGPQFGFNISADAEFDGDTEDIEDAQTIDFGVGIGAQYIFPMNLFFQARYVIGVTNVFEEIEGFQPDAKNSVLSLSVGYFFN
ncbi:porin family protein [Aequorivita echinoideorum]|uniref:Outer membrane beta-barrel protein n=1 Tax=Aequorivita echinoideorum TaxID=1549647 RepID=A0ABS5S6E6_9FLAO|nr:porin family protein [Aequorivita echinoideorum]MBT0608776.1 outer membrane beta-barrel protein [Aequorivita echinoideorum]